MPDRVPPDQAGTGGAGPEHAGSEHAGSGGASPDRQDVPGHAGLDRADDPAGSDPAGSDQAGLDRTDGPSGSEPAGNEADHAGADPADLDPSASDDQPSDGGATGPAIPGRRRPSPGGWAPGGAVPDQGAPGRDGRMSFPDLSTADDAGPDGPSPRDRPRTHDALPDPDPYPDPDPDDGPRPAGLAALSLRYQIAAAFALAVVAVASCVHLGMVFLHVAPSNTVTKQHGRVIDEWIYPEFEQNWKLFAPNPLQQNIGVQVRALVRSPDGISRETGWYDLSALDGRAIDGNPLPSHTQQNELRRAWDFYVGTHDAENRPAGLRGDLSERYLRRIAVLRLDREHAGGAGAAVERVQFRSRTTDVQPPRWSDEKVSDRPVVRELPWWPVPAADRAGGLTEASAR
ncbi:DUF5819 family protein [Streptomyces sp. NBC_01428]|uniref:DUF5819 family protein n=1 Tax=Streptomyces sp. NBC_01428 TaxID=2903861 RepID=UPI003FCC5E95